MTLHPSSRIAPFCRSDRRSFEPRKAPAQTRRIESAGSYQSECRPGGPYGALKKTHRRVGYHIDNRARG